MKNKSYFKALISYGDALWLVGVCAITAVHQPCINRASAVHMLCLWADKPGV